MNDTVERLYPKLRPVAVNVAGQVGESLLDDLVQHMALAILQCKPGQTDAFYLRRGADRVRNYLRHENKQPAAFTDTGHGVYGPETVRS